VSYVVWSKRNDFRRDPAVGGMAVRLKVRTGTPPRRGDGDPQTGASARLGIPASMGDNSLSLIGRAFSPTDKVFQLSLKGLLKNPLLKDWTS